MEATGHATFDASRVAAKLEHELNLVSNAVSAVASGDFVSVTVSGMRFGEELLPSARAMAAERGLRVRALYPADEHGADILVERP